MSNGSSGFSLEAITLEMFLYMTLQKAIGRNLFGVWECYSLGMSTMNVAFKEGSIHLFVLDSSTTCQNSSLISSQKLWKKLDVKPSRPGTFPSLSCCMAFSTSYKDIALRRSWLCSSIMIFGTFLVIFSIASSRSSWVSWCTCLKWVRSPCSTSSCFSSRSPCRFRMWVMLLCILL